MTKMRAKPFMIDHVFRQSPMQSKDRGQPNMKQKFQSNNVWRRNFPTSDHLEWVRSRKNEAVRAQQLGPGTICYSCPLWQHLSIRNSNRLCLLAIQYTSTSSSLLTSTLQAHTSSCHVLICVFPVGDGWARAKVAMHCDPPEPPQPLHPQSFGTIFGNCA